MQRGVKYRSGQVPALAILSGGIPQTVVGSGVLGGSFGETLTTTRNLAKFVSRADGLYLSVGVNQPGVDYRGLLVEAAHTNLAVRSQDFQNASWNPVASTLNPTLANNPAGTPAAPDGTATAARVTQNQNVTAGGSFSIVRQIISNSGNASFTFSVWLRAGTLDNVWLYINDNTGGIGTPIKCALTNEWQRFSVTTAKGTITQVIPSFGYAQSLEAQTISGGTIYIWGGQLETGTYAHSYVPTTAAAVTEPMDQVVVSTANWPVAAGVVEFDLVPLWPTGATGTAAIFDSRSGGTVGATWTIDMPTGAMNLAAGGVSTLSSNLTFTPGQRYHMRGEWGPTVRIYRDDVLVGSNASAAAPTSHTATTFIGAQANNARPADCYISNLVFRNR